MWFDIETERYGQDGPDYDVVCPKCRHRSVGKTYSRGVRGTYRNPYVGYCVRRIICATCGVVGELNSGPSLDYQLWYRIRVGDNVVWAINERHLQQIRDVLVGDEDRNESFLYALPKWLVKGSNRSKAIAEIDKMLEDPSRHGTGNV